MWTKRQNGRPYAHSLKLLRPGDDAARSSGRYVTRACSVNAELNQNPADAVQVIPKNCHDLRRTTARASKRPRAKSTATSPKNCARHAAVLQINAAQLRIARGPITCRQNKSVLPTAVPEHCASPAHK